MKSSIEKFGSKDNLTTNVHFAKLMYTPLTIYNPYSIKFYIRVGTRQFSGLCNIYDKILNGL